MSAELSLTNRIIYNDLKREKATEGFNVAHLQRALLAVTLACAILSLIPNLGMAGSIATRSVALLAASAQCFEAWRHEGLRGLALQVIRVVLVILGLTGVITRINPLVVAALATDILLQAAEASRGLASKDVYKALSHFSLILINSFVIAGMLTSSWGFIVAAGTISAVTMFVFAAIAAYRAFVTKDPSHIFDAVCYTMLGGIGIASSAISAELFYKHPTKYYYTIQNNTTDGMSLWSPEGKFLGEAEAGRTVTIAVNPEDTLNGSVRFVHGGGGPGHEHFIGTRNYDFEYLTIKPPMTAQEFPTLPIGGPSIVVGDPQWPTNGTTPEKIELNKRLDAFREASKQPLQPALFSSSSKPFKFIHEKSKKESTVNLVTLCQQSEYFKGAKHIEALGDEPNAATLDLDEPIFDLLMRYLKEGNLNTLEKLTEEELTGLYTVADYLMIPHLRDLCTQQIAQRLQEVTWQDTGLLKPYQNSSTSLNKLLELYNF